MQHARHPNRFGRSGRTLHYSSASAPNTSEDGSINNSPPQQASLRLTPLRNDPRCLSHTIFNLHQHKSLALIFVATFPCNLSSSTLYFDTIGSYTQLSSTRYSLNRYNVAARCQCACRHSKRLCEPFRILSNKECVSA